MLLCNKKDPPTINCEKKIIMAIAILGEKICRYRQINKNSGTSKGVHIVNDVLIMMK